MMDDDRCHICNRPLHIKCQGCGRPACAQHSEVLVRCADCGEQIRVGVVDLVREKVDEIQAVVLSLMDENVRVGNELASIVACLSDVTTTLDTVDGDRTTPDEESEQTHRPRQSEGWWAEKPAGASNWTTEKSVRYLLQGGPSRMGRSIQLQE